MHVFGFHVSSDFSQEDVIPSSVPQCLVTFWLKTRGTDNRGIVSKASLTLLLRQMRFHLKFSLT